MGTYLMCNAKLMYNSLSLDYKEEQDGEIEAIRSIYTEEEFKGGIIFRTLF